MRDEVLIKRDNGKVPLVLWNVPPSHFGTLHPRKKGRAPVIISFFLYLLAVGLLTLAT